MPADKVMTAMTDARDGSVTMLCPRKPRAETTARASTVP